ncbi:response regulator [Paenibacillus sp. HJL G12]|uniref:Response regulator n=1 Tax=Paenibacillus dendrobii TaxID=2691084 RepID=A0A7X3LF92_9BACL|nr:response regulator [Paenibacillus dendrobii]
MKHILVVDDEPRTREGIRKTLEMWSSGGYRIEVASSGMEALAWLDAHEASLIITDIRMPEMSGLELVGRLCGLPHPPVVIIISGHSDFEYAHSALKFGVMDYLLKPLDKTKLVQAVETALEREAWNDRMEKMQKLVDPKLLETVQEEKVYSPQVQKALQYVDEHLQESVSLRETAEHLHMNASYFSVHFKEQTGLTFSDYITRSRIQRAKQLLTSTRLSVAEIAQQAGYQTSKYFVKVFRAMENVSPGQYRQQWLDDEQKIQ